jgi:hypothetical protein
MSLVLQSSGGGSVTLNEPTTASNFTQDLPAASGTVVITGTTPTLNGITFPATQVPSADANTLDDYEEGTWTPTDGSGAGLIFSQNSGRYTKIGREVTCYMTVEYPSTASGTNAQIDGLPFSSATAGVSSGFGGSISFTNLNENYAFFINNGVTNIITHTYAGARISNATFSTKILYVVIQYQTST